MIMLVVFSTDLISMFQNVFQISGELDVVKDALMQVTSRLRANLFEREGPASAFVPVHPYLPMTTDSDTLKHESRDTRRHGHSYSAGYGGSSDLPRANAYGSYSGIQVTYMKILWELINFTCSVNFF